MVKLFPVKRLSLIKSRVMPKRKVQNEAKSAEMLARFREKRKWQIALRRYVLEKAPSQYYAPYFGLDIHHLRNWFESQFFEGVSWADFGRKWQFDHVVPVAYFDFKKDEELKLCWNFTNLRVDQFLSPNEGEGRLDLMIARNYFRELWEKAHYPPLKGLLDKIDQIEASERIETGSQLDFIQRNTPYLDMIKGYSRFEFDLLNQGRSLEEVERELEILRKLVR